MRQYTHETRLTVRYSETDQMGVAYYANYFVWMEVARVELMKSLGLCYRDLEQLGFLLAVAEAHCRYVSPARYDDQIVVETRLRKATARLVEFDYCMRRAADGAELASGYTKHVVCGPDLRPKRLSAEYLFILTKLASQDPRSLKS